jgi:uncharacterized UPF0160 family protein
MSDKGSVPLLSTFTNAADVVKSLNTLLGTIEDMKEDQRGFSEALKLMNQRLDHFDQRLKHIDEKLDLTAAKAVLEAGQKASDYLTGMERALNQRLDTLGIGTGAGPTLQAANAANTVHIADGTKSDGSTSA